MQKDNAIEQAETAEVVRYVNLLLQDMEQKQTASVAIRKSVPLPETRDQREKTRPVPGYGAAIARLKIMSGLDPSATAESADGCFPVSFADRKYTVRTRFEDCGEDPRCTIELQKEPS